MTWEERARHMEAMLTDIYVEVDKLDEIKDICDELLEVAPEDKALFLKHQVKEFYSTIDTIMKLASEGLAAEEVKDGHLQEL